MKLTTRLVIWVLPALFASAIEAQDSELLEPDKAFAVSAQAIDARRIEVRWDIADDYYMYRDKFKFAVTDGGQLGAVSFPDGKIKSDEFFGDVEVYLHQARFELQLTGSTSRVILQVDGQGCNEPIGVCYPPMTKELAVEMPPAAAGFSGLANDLLNGATRSSPVTNSNGAVDELRNLLGNLVGGDEFLHVDDAFRVTIEHNGDSQLLASYRIADGYYLYQDKITFSVVSGAARTGEPRLPAGTEKEDEYFGLMTVYLEDFRATIPLIRSTPEAGPLVIEAGYQGCAEDGICYPPVTRQFTLELPQLISTASASPLNAAPGTGTGTQTGFISGAFLGYLLSAFGIGLLLTFTPCVLPLIPILSSIIVGQGAGMSRAKGGMLSTIYVLGTATTYAVIGWVAGATGEQLQAYFQNIWAIGAISIVFVLMALAMFGLYKIQMPSFIQSRLQDTSSGIRGGTAGMVFVLGIVSALIVGACVSPLLISVLAIAIGQGDPILGAAMMVAMAMGMGVFLIALGFGAGFLLPRAGAWMTRVNYVFGVMLIAVAIYLLQALPQVPVLLLWAALFIIVAVYLGATQALPEGASGWRYLNKGIGTILLVWGVLSLAGGLAGNRDVLNPIPAGTFGIAGVAGGTSGAGASHAEDLFIRVSTPEELDVQLAAARNQNRHLMLDFYADWCIDCIRMEKTTFVDALVKRRFDDDFLLVQVDVTDPNHEGGKALKRKYGVYGPPAILFFRPDGVEIDDLRLYGYQNRDEFLEILSRI